MDNQCAECNISLKKRSRSSFTRTSSGVTYCKKCYNLIHKRTNVTTSVSTISDSIDSDSASSIEHSISLPLNQASGYHGQCIFDCKNSQTLRLLSKTECLHVYFKTNIFVKYGARICHSHGSNDALQIPTNFAPYSDSVNLTSNDVHDLLQALKKMYVNDTTSSAIISFLNMKSDILIFETGLNTEQYLEVLSLIESCEISVINKEFALGVYLSRLRRAYTFEELAIKWKIDRNTAGKYCKILMNCLEETLIPKYLRFPLNRTEAFEHLTETSKIFYAPNGDKIILIFDGTYLFIQKGADFSFQRNTYCMHKSRNLIKPMMAVYPDGYIAGVFGPYPGKKNDASIMIELLEKDYWSSFQEGDVLVVDRGFRDSLTHIEEKGFLSKMPSFADGPRLPLTTEQANISRLVTRVRFQVEKVNGNVKSKFKYFNQTTQNTVLPHLFSDFKVACALYNLTFKKSIPNELEREIAYNMLERSTQKNLLQVVIKEEKLNGRRSKFASIESSTIEFPILTLNDLYRYTCGCYQLRMANRYFADHVNSNGDFLCQIAKETSKIDFVKYGINVQFCNSLLFKAQIRSRHSNSVKYYVYVLLDTTLDGLQSIIGHSCGCKVGNRVNGCCSHVTLIIWYFGYRRFHDMKNPEIHENQVFPSEIASDDTDESEESEEES
ncbi:uncharacterized protein LOC122507514 [Leptopilina heterotoma]|uniref:uncharacterized protein LOC122507514 n=1 Tax=Leptopilina heterotoma TaxID=63436 RepID=UPI001CA9858C|nr:uncharacterized protein LOC122507514 [Leptopilina heterotoma]